MLLVEVKTRHDFVSSVWFWLISAGVLHGMEGVRGGVQVFRVDDGDGMSSTRELGW